MGRLPRPALFEEIRQRLKIDAKRDDIVMLVAWLLTHFTDDGLLRSPQAARRATIVLSGSTYWLVRVPPPATPEARDGKGPP